MVVALAHGFGTALANSDFMSLTSSGRLPLRELVLLRYVLIIAVSYLLIMPPAMAAASSTLAAGLLVAAAFASNVLLAEFGSRRFGQWHTAGIVVVDTLWISTSMLLIGRASSEFFFLYFFVIFFAALAENLVLMLGGVLAAGGAYLWVLARLHPGAAWREEHFLQIAFLFTGALFYGVLVQRTRTQRRYAEITEATDQARTELLATLAHDIGGPAHVIAMGVETMQRTIEENSFREADSLLGTVLRNSRYLTQLVQQFMEYARVRSGRYQLHPTELIVNAVIERVVARHEDGAKLRGVSLRFEPGALLPTVHLDEFAMVRILSNLVDNAVRHSDHGQTVALRAERDDEGFRIIVEDSGPGFDPAQRDRIGQPFLDASRTHGGAGLGLFIARSLAEAQGGSLLVDSEPGRGTRCVIRLPFAVMSAANLSAPLDV